MLASYSGYVQADATLRSMLFIRTKIALRLAAGLIADAALRMLRKKAIQSDSGPSWPLRRFTNSKKNARLNGGLGELRTTREIVSKPIIHGLFNW